MKKLLQTRLNPEILRFVQEISEFKERWDLSKEKDRDAYGGLKKSTIITSAGASTRIEGARLTDDEIVQRLKGLRIKKIHDRDEAEVQGYIDSLHHIFDNFAELGISEHSIRSLHQMMCAYLPSDAMPPHQRGAYKDVVNSVVRIDHVTGEREVIFETTPPGIRTETEMRDLIADYEGFTGDANYSDLEVIAAFIVKFLAIHPFRDGNGRMARLLTNLCLLRQGYEFTMFSSHEKAVEDNKEAYYVALRQTQNSGDLNPWFHFFLKTLEIQAARLKKNMIVRRDGDMTALEERVLDFVRAHQPVTIGFLERNAEIKRPTLKAILARLKDRGIIRMDGSRKGSTYSIRWGDSKHFFREDS